MTGETTAINDLAGFSRYAARFSRTFITAALWGRDQVIGALTVLAVLVYQIWDGQLTIANAQTETWPVLRPYLWVIGGYVLFHAAITAWKLDKQQEELIGLRVNVSGAFEETRLVLTIRNDGPTDQFFGEIWAVLGPYESAVATVYARWRDAGTDDTIELRNGQTRYIDLLDVPDIQGDANAPTFQLLRSTGTTDFVSRSGGGLIDDVHIQMRVKAVKQDLRKHISLFMHLDRRSNGRLERRVYFEPQSWSRGV